MQCKHCSKKEWACLGCNKMVSVKYFSIESNDVAVYCNCCNHNFACKECYDKNPGYNYWKGIFGSEHAITDKISGESSLSRTLQALFGGNLNSAESVAGFPNVKIVRTNNF